jgi:F0F1-type ATP synthase beta subunit
MNYILLCVIKKGKVCIKNMLVLGFILHINAILIVPIVMSNKKNVSISQECYDIEETIKVPVSVAKKSELI